MVGHDVFSVTTVQMAAGEQGLIAEVFSAGLTENALTTCPAQLGNTHPLADAFGVCISAHSHDVADDFMPRHPWQYRLRQFTLHQM